MKKKTPKVFCLTFEVHFIIPMLFSFVGILFVKYIYLTSLQFS